MELEVEVETLALGTDGDARDDGDSVAAIKMPHDRRSANGRPGLRDSGGQEEA
jgi:hypothetical protein